MKIRFASGGGVAGPAGHRSCVVDTTKLSGTEASQVQALVRAANVPGLVGRASPPSRPDEMYYEVTIEEGGGSYTVSATNRDMPAGLKPLVAWLTARAASELK
jgi:hypothetical protein